MLQMVHDIHNLNTKLYAENLLKLALNNESASFREGQWDSILGIINRKKILVVQRTGWGKSMVYFIASKLLRLDGKGPTLLISPLLSLMRNQMESARKLGLITRTINSTNSEEWTHVQEELESDKVDVLFISPERLANSEFKNSILNKIANNIGLLVVDEAHCISDWGHDFRPDYKLINNILRLLPANLPVLATTATANNRVVEDIKKQLGKNLIVQRGPLIRSSLKLQNIELSGKNERLAWLAKTIPLLPGCGIIYTLTQDDAEMVAEWLCKFNIDAKAYHSGLPDDSNIKEHLEQELLDNKIKVLCATVALGMGFDKPDLSFVIHFQRPSSVVHYYQQVGRAGRNLENAYGILLHGEEDDRIADYFRNMAFPPQKHIMSILNVLEQYPDGASTSELMRAINLGKSQLDKSLKFLNSEPIAPIVKIGPKWYLTPAAISYSVDLNHIDKITKIRIAEQKEMNVYMSHQGCLMSFLQRSLDDQTSGVCGKCANCTGNIVDKTYDSRLSLLAIDFLKDRSLVIEPKKRWPAKNMFKHYPFDGYMIHPELLAEKGRVLSRWQDGGWGKLVADNKYKDNFFSDELVRACTKLIKSWNPTPTPKWLTCVPSLTRPDLVPNFAQRLATALDIPFIMCIEKQNQNSAQKNMQNSWHQVANLDGAFKIDTTVVPKAPCFLIDDIVTSGWTMTILSALLRLAGCEAVFPLSLTFNPRRDS